MTEHHVTLIGHLVLLLTTLAGFLFQWLREGRRHRWQQEENRQMRAEMKAVAVEVKNGHAVKA